MNFIELIISISIVSLSIGFLGKKISLQYKRKQLKLYLKMDENEVKQNTGPLKRAKILL